MKMDKAVKKRWLKALRSGSYAQGAGRLKNYENKFCCLGVLCDILPNEGSWKDYDKKYQSSSDFILKETKEVSNGHLPLSLIKKFQLSELQVRKLVDMNDTEKKTFKEIAAYISRNM